MRPHSQQPPECGRKRAREGGRGYLVKPNAGARPVSTFNKARTTVKYRDQQLPCPALAARVDLVSLLPPSMMPRTLFESKSHNVKQSASQQATTCFPRIRHHSDASAPK